MNSVDGEKTDFTQQENLNVHFSHHVKCSVCNGLFTDRDSLVQHMRSHTRQTWFQCSVCGKDFAWRRHLTRHMQAHINEEIDSSLCDSDDDGNYLKLSTHEQHLLRPMDVWENVGVSEQNDLSPHHFINQSSQIYPSQTEESKQENEQINRGDFRGPEPTWHSKLDPDLQGKVEDEASESSDPDTDDSDFWKETRKCKSNLISVKHGDIIQRDTKTNIHQFQSGEDSSEHNMQKEIQQEDTEPPQVKKEQEEIEILKLTSSPGSVKFEEGEGKPWAFWLYSSCKEENIDSFGGQTAKNSDSGFRADYLISDGSVDSDIWKETKKPQSNLNSDSCINPLSVSDGAVESLQAGSDDSVDSDFWNATRKPPAYLHAKDTEASEEVLKDKKNVKPYSCRDCGKTFAQICHMNTHMKQHADKRPYSCSVCGQEYPFRSQMEIHMRAHTGEKPFQCPVCGRKYSYKASMKSHMVMAHTETNQYNCDVCATGFAWYTEFKYHQCVGETSHQ
ncbi:hypothetical protein AMECASPLE_031548 [Ameca splendens]|uniref:C2H2-type domain-containing protein n=1 Tax=Ameca splendens TaxID=208324 RepID=A0ABV1ACP1_9TELE